MLLNTRWNYQQFKAALKAVAATAPNLELFYQNKLGWTCTLELNILNAYLRYQPVCGERVCLCVFDRVNVGVCEIENRERRDQFNAVLFK